MLHVQGCVAACELRLFASLTQAIKCMSGPMLIKVTKLKIHIFGKPYNLQLKILQKTRIPGKVSTHSLR